LRSGYFSFSVFVDIPLAWRDLAPGKNYAKMAKRMSKFTSKLWRRKQKLKTAKQVFDMIELSDSAMRKLAIGEELSDAEVAALFDSDYVRDGDQYPQFLQGDTPLYSAPGSVSLIHLVDVEREMFAYFARHPDQMRLIPPRKFEELVAAVLKNNGFDVTLTPETRDGGIDIIAVQKDVLGGDLLHLVECKRYAAANKVGIGIVQRLAGVVDQHRANRGLIVTTSSFTEDAEEVRRTMPHKLAFGPFADLSQWIAKIHERNQGTYR
jgi:restriction system protein